MKRSCVRMKQMLLFEKGIGKRSLQLMINEAEDECCKWDQAKGQTKLEGGERVYVHISL